jgi:hypothetical protein
VVVHDLDVFGVGTRPAKADPKLIVHANAPLAGAITLQLLQPVRGRRAQILDAPRELDLLELAQRRALDTRAGGSMASKCVTLTRVLSPPLQLTALRRVSRPLLLLDLPSYLRNE